MASERRRKNDLSDEEDREVIKIHSKKKKNPKGGEVEGQEIEVDFYSGNKENIPSEKIAENIKTKSKKKKKKDQDVSENVSGEGSKNNPIETKAKSKRQQKKPKENLEANVDCGDNEGHPKEELSENDPEPIDDHVKVQDIGENGEKVQEVIPVTKPKNKSKTKVKGKNKGNSDNEPQALVSLDEIDDCDQAENIAYKKRRGKEEIISEGTVDKNDLVLESANYVEGLKNKLARRKNVDLDIVDERSGRQKSGDENLDLDKNENLSENQISHPLNVTYVVQPRVTRSQTKKHVPSTSNSKMEEINAEVDKIHIDENTKNKKSKIPKKTKQTKKAPGTTSADSGLMET